MIGATWHSGMRKGWVDQDWWDTASRYETRQIFIDYLGVDVTESWIGLNADAAASRKALDNWISKRGQAVHRSKASVSGVPPAHLVRREDLEKVIRFVKLLVENTDQCLEDKL